MYITLLIISNFAWQIKIVMSALILLQFYKWYVDVTNSKRMKVNTKVLILNFSIISRRNYLNRKKHKPFIYNTYAKNNIFFNFLYSFDVFPLLFTCIRCLYNIIRQYGLTYYIWAKKRPLSFNKIYVVAPHQWYIDIYMEMSSWIYSSFCSLVSFQHHIGAFLLREGPVENKTEWNNFAH